jgi:hypothetical protein
LARTLSRIAPDARKFIIIDACFAGAAQPDFIPQGPAAERMEEQTMAGFAESGTALLCAASAADVALAPVLGTYTMFSDALLHVMQRGSPNRGAYLSFDDMRSLATQFIRQKHRDDAVLPEVHVPDQRRGDLASIKFLPNPATLTDSQKPVWRPYRAYAENLIQLALRYPLRSSLGTGVLSAIACFLVAKYPRFSLTPSEMLQLDEGVIFGSMLALWLYLFGARSKPLLLLAVLFVTLGWYVAVNATITIDKAIPGSQVVSSPLSAQSDADQQSAQDAPPETVVRPFQFAGLIAGLAGGFIGAASVALAASLNRKRFRRIEPWSLTLLTGTILGGAGMHYFETVHGDDIAYLVLFLLWQPSILMIVCYSLRQEQ